MLSMLILYFIIFLVFYLFSSKSINDYSEESDTDKEGTMTSEDDPNRLWCICRKPHNNR